MEGAIAGLITSVGEAGVLAAFELLVIVGLVVYIRDLSKRSNELVDTIFGMHKSTLDVVSKNSEVMSKLTEKIDAKSH